MGVEGERGYDPARSVVGRKRHALTDTDGRLLIAAVSPANLHDSHAGIALLRASRRLWPFLAHCFADHAYRGKRVGTTNAITIEIVVPKEGQKGFVVQPQALGYRTHLRLDQPLPQAGPRSRSDPRQEWLLRFQKRF